MLPWANSTLRRHLPSIHARMRGYWHRLSVPVPRIHSGRLFLLHPSLIGVEPHEPHITGWISDLLQPGDTFFDVGAHHGWMSLTACERVGRRGSVVAFEPSPPLVELLLYHKRLNNLTKLEVVSKAVSSCNGSGFPFALVQDGHSSMNALVLSAARTHAQSVLMPVETITLDSFAESSARRPSLIKIDVEGAELLVLQGAHELLRQQRPGLIIAVHPPWLPKGQQESDIFNLLANYGYRISDSHLVRYQGTDFGDYLCLAA